MIYESGLQTGRRARARVRIRIRASARREGMKDGGVEDEEKRREKRGEKREKRKQKREKRKEKREKRKDVGEETDGGEISKVGSGMMVLCSGPSKLVLVRVV